ncbi:MAG: hypothetical protein HND58_10045 [Planctomycetota bacterium]|nr:MAG: hypothetical protein HND58_10045 [Planctomycetota bacterium]
MQADDPHGRAHCLPRALAPAVPEAVLGDAAGDVARTAGLADDPGRGRVDLVPPRGVEQLHPVVYVVARRAGVRGPVAEVLIEHADERPAHGVSLRAVDHEGSDDLVVDALRLADAETPVLAAEVGLFPVVGQGADEAGGALGEVRGEQGVVLEHQQHAAAAVEAVGEPLARGCGCG